VSDGSEGGPERVALAGAEPEALEPGSSVAGFGTATFPTFEITEPTVPGRLGTEGTAGEGTWTPVTFDAVPVAAAAAPEITLVTRSIGFELGVAGVAKGAFGDPWPGADAGFFVLC
jgi:hypothetical protein